MDTDTATRALSVLLAGDEDWQAAAAMQLGAGDHDISVETAGDAGDCLTALATDHHPDAVVVAPKLPDGDGAALCELVAERYDLTAVVYAEDGAAAERARGAGVPVVESGDLVGRLAAATFGERKRDDSHLRAFVEAVEQSGHSIYITDRDGTIEYVNPTFEETTGFSRAEAVGQNPRILQSGHHDEEFYAEVWDTILEGEVWEGDIVNERKDGQPYHVHQTIAPITDEEGTVQRFVAVNADITERKRREQEIQRQSDLLDRLNRVNAAVWAVSQALLRARTREEIEQAVCDRLADTGLYVAAWIGGYDAAAGEVTPRAASGVDSLPEPASADGNGVQPAVRAARSGEVELVQDDDQNRPRRQAFVALCYNGVTHGVLCVRAEGSRCIGEYECTSLRELGTTVGYAVAATRTRRLLDADDAVELTLASGDDRSPLVRASETDAQLSLSAAVRGTENRELYYLTVTGEDPAGAVERARGTEGVERARVACKAEDGWLVELTVTGPSLTRTLADTGAHIVSATAADGRVELCTELPLSADLRRALRAARTAFPDLELLAKRTVERPRDGDGLPAPDRLTERQRSALQAAYHGGYFDWPRASTAQELAATMGISDVTFHKHLRRAEEKLLEQYLGQD